MLNTLQLSDLVNPVIDRARTDVIRRATGFADWAAKNVLERLGVDARQYSSQTDRIAPEIPLLRCMWIDRQLQQFFALHPDGQGIEINGGLSTRFHRISALLDWPRFSWSAINSPDVTDCLQYVFPTLDNHRFIASDAPLQCWNKHIEWHGQEKKIAVFGEHEPLRHWQEFDLIYTTIQESLTDATPEVDLLLCHGFYDFTAQLHYRNARVSVIAMHRDTEPTRGLLTRCLASLSNTKRNSQIFVHHLRISQNATRNTQPKYSHQKD